MTLRDWQMYALGMACANVPALLFGPRTQVDHELSTILFTVAFFVIGAIRKA
jgi:hypothetical protein